MHTDRRTLDADLMLVVTGVRPDVKLGVQAGARLGAARALAGDEHMWTGVPGVWAAGAVDLTIRLTADERDGRLLGGQIAGHLSGEVAKRIDTIATALHNRMTVDELNDLDLSYSPPFSAPWIPCRPPPRRGWPRLAR